MQRADTILKTTPDVQSDKTKSGPGCRETSIRTNCQVGVWGFYYSNQKNSDLKTPSNLKCLCLAGFCCQECKADVSKKGFASLELASHLVLMWPVSDDW